MGAGVNGQTNAAHQAAANLNTQIDFSGDMLIMPVIDTIQIQ